MLEFLFSKLKLATTPKPLRRIHPDALWQVKTNDKVVYLTFDDGPIPGVTDKIIELLKQFNAKATFFCIGENVVLHPSLYRSLIQNGHAVGNHTQNHINGKQSENQLYFNNIKECSKHVDSKLFRPPFGQLKNSQYKILKEDYTIVMWSTLSWDFDDSLSPEQCAKKVLNHIQNGSIIVFHDSLKAAPNSIPALEQVLKSLSQEGYSFLSLEQN